jgi:hypothetical protein
LEKHLQDSWQVEIEEVDVALDTCLDENWRALWGLTSRASLESTFQPQLFSFSLIDCIRRGERLIESYSEMILIQLH